MSTEESNNISTQLEERPPLERAPRCRLLKVFVLDERGENRKKKKAIKKKKKKKKNAKKKALKQKANADGTEDIPVVDQEGQLRPGGKKKRMKQRPPLLSMASFRASIRMNMDGSISVSSRSDLAEEVQEQEKPISSSEVKTISGDAHPDVDLELAESPNTSLQQNASIGKTVDSGEPLRRTRCTGARMMGLFLCLSLAAAAAAWLVLQYFNEEDSWIERLDSYPRNTEVSRVPHPLCNEGYPGQGLSQVCSIAQTMQQGGNLCNLVAQAMMNVTASDIAIVNSGVCLTDIQAPLMTVENIHQAVAQHQIVIVEMSGGYLLQLLEQAMEATFGEVSQETGAYPYAAGLRFDVSANMDFGGRVQSAQVEKYTSWQPVSRRRFYKVATTLELARGDLGYSEFAKVIDAWKTPVDANVGDAFLDYSLHANKWWDLSVERYSTRSFVGPNVEPAIAFVPDTVCLEWAPRAGMSHICPISSVTRGGGVCNLVAWGLLDQNLRAQVAILKASDCASDIQSGPFTQSEVKSLLTAGQDLVTVDVSGEQILGILNKAVDASLDNGGAGMYPYGAALRFRVDTTVLLGNRVSVVEVFNNYNRWDPLHPTGVYKVITTRELVTGKVPAYDGFLESDSATIRITGASLRDTFTDFAMEWKVLYDPPAEKYSTQHYIA